jgi:hypothetical protein
LQVRCQPRPRIGAPAIPGLLLARRPTYGGADLDVTGGASASGTGPDVNPMRKGRGTRSSLSSLRPSLNPRTWLPSSATGTGHTRSRPPGIGSDPGGRSPGLRHWAGCPPRARAGCLRTPAPEATRRAAPTAVADCHLCLRPADELGSLSRDQRFADPFPDRGRPALARRFRRAGPWSAQSVSTPQDALPRELAGSSRRRASPPGRRSSPG